MVRPFKGLTTLMELMAAELASQQPAERPWQESNLRPRD